MSEQITGKVLREHTLLYELTEDKNSWSSRSKLVNRWFAGVQGGGASAASEPERAEIADYLQGAYNACKAAGISAEALEAGVIAEMVAYVRLGCSSDYSTDVAAIMLDAIVNNLDKKS